MVLFGALARRLSSLFVHYLDLHSLGLFAGQQHLDFFRLVVEIKSLEKAIEGLITSWLLLVLLMQQFVLSYFFIKLSTLSDLGVKSLLELIPLLLDNLSRRV